MKRTLIIGTILSLMAFTAQADIFGFDTVTTNSPFNSAVAGQLFMDTTVTDIGESSVSFTNTGPLASTVTEIYFGSNEELNLNLDFITSSSLGVDFDISGASPENPPGMDEFGNWWTITIAAAEANPPPAANGIDPLEYLDLQISYGGLLSFSQLIQLGQLQVALHVVSMPDGESDTFVNGTDVIPEPASIALIGVTGLLLAFVRRRFI
jgi:hypothetical protein